MKNKIVIGKEMTIKSILLNYSILIIYIGFWMTLGVYFCVGILLKLDYQTRIILTFITILLMLLLSTPMIGATQRIEFSKDKVIYYGVKGMVNQFKEVIRILIGKKERVAISLNVPDIDKMRLSYRRTAAGYGLIGYALVLNFLMKDGTVITLSPENMNKTKDGYYARALELLKEQDIEVIDKWNLEDSLSKSSTVFQKYVGNVEKEKHNYD